MWTYRQSDGQVTGPNGNQHGCGYSGRGIGKNAPSSQNIPTVGPLPQGSYTMQPPVDTQARGPYVIWLTPDPENEMFGRSAFGIHGDSIEHPGMASEGCICLPRSTREIIWQSGDRRLIVTS